jgi:hypothetical protein
MRLFERARQRVLGATVVGLLALLTLIGCGDGKDAPSTPTPGPDGTVEPTRPVATATATLGPATVLTPATTPAPDIPAPGVEYVRAMCIAMQDFAAGVGKKLETDPSLTQDNSRLLSVFGPIVQDYANVIATLKPPVEWKADHDRFAGIIRDLVPKMRSGEVKSFADFNVYVLGTGKLKPLNAAAFKRIDEIIGQTEECSTVGFIFGGL